MIDAGVMEGVDFVYGCHLWTPLAFGKVAVHTGPFMAASDFFDMTIRGRGGHAGLPHDTTDPVAIAAQVVTNLQHVVSRRTDPLRSAVVTIGSFHAGDAPNVIPETAELSGTVRSFDPEVRERLPGLIEQITTGVAGAHGAEAELEYIRGYRAVVNDENVAELVRSVVPDGALTEIDPIMGGDDFSAYLGEAPGCYAFIGAGGEFPHHHPRFVIDERALSIGTRLHVDVARRVLASAR
jgi:amidohydrolase